LNPVIRFPAILTPVSSRLMPRCVCAALLLAVLACNLSAQDVTGTQEGAKSFDQVAAGAAAARANNDMPRAIELYTEAVRLNAQWAEGWWFLGLMHFQSEDYTDAREEFTHFLDLKTDRTKFNAQATALRGLSEFEMADYAHALPDLGQGIAMGAAEDAASGSFLQTREAQALTRLGHFDEALGIYTSLANKGEITPELKISVGLAGLRVAQLPTDLLPSQQELYTAAGDATLRFIKGDQEGARTAFESFFERFPTTPNAHYLYGMLMLVADQDETVTQCKLELTVAPDNVPVMSFLAWVLLLEGHPAQALPYAQKAVAAAPVFANAQMVLGRSLAETGDLTGGIAHLETALQIQPNDVESHVALAAAYSNAGRKADAQQQRKLSLEMAKAQFAKQ
jgi:tetratricopeptide (TPR) repeat protein